MLTLWTSDCLASNLWLKYMILWLSPLNNNPWVTKMLLIFQKHQLNSSSESKMASLSLFTAPVGEKLKCARGIYYFVHYHSLIGLHIKFVLLWTLGGDPYIYNIISPGNEPTDEELLQFITGKYSPAIKQFVLLLFCLVYSGPNTELLAQLGSKPWRLQQLERRNWNLISYTFINPVENGRSLVPSTTNMILTLM